jgi:hypothetical protein
MSSQVTIESRNFIFEKSEWEYLKSKDGVTVKGRPGTWALPWDNAPPGVIGIVCCPNCGSNSVLHARIHHITYLGKIQPDFRCTGCPFEAITYLDKWGNKPLYACAIEVDGKPEIHFMHASTQAEARIHLGPVQHKRDYRIVAIGRAIGHHIEDEHGEVAHAD